MQCSIIFTIANESKNCMFGENLGFGDIEVILMVISQPIIIIAAELILPDMKQSH